MAKGVIGVGAEAKAVVGAVGLAAHQHLKALVDNRADQGAHLLRFLGS